MEARATCNAIRSFAHRPIRLVIVRANGPFFYSVAAAALLESNVAANAERMGRFFAGDGELCAWIHGEWRPRKADRAEQLRWYVEAIWPEFDWPAAWEHYRALSEVDGGAGPRQPTAAHEALARCMVAAQAAVFYRTLTRWADDARLRDMARTMAREEAASLPRFRAAFEQRARARGLNFVGAWRTVPGARLSRVRRPYARGNRASRRSWGAGARAIPAVEEIPSGQRRKSSERCADLVQAGAARGGMTRARSRADDLSSLLKIDSSPRRRPGSSKHAARKSMPYWMPAFSGMTKSWLLPQISTNC